MKPLTPEQQDIAELSRHIETVRIETASAVPDVHDLLLWVSHLSDAADPTQSHLGAGSRSAEVPLPFEPHAWARAHLDTALSAIRTVTNGIQTALEVPPDQRTKTEADRKCPACGRRRPVRIRVSEDGPVLDGRITEAQTLHITTLAEQVYGSTAVLERHLGTKLEQLDRRAAKRLIRSMKG